MGRLEAHKNVSGCGMGGSATSHKSEGLGWRGCAPQNAIFANFLAPEARGQGSCAFEGRKESAVANVRANPGGLRI